MELTLNPVKRRGVVFTGGEGPEPERAAALAAGAALTAAADSGLIAAERAGITPDIILGDMDSLDTRERLEKYDPQKVKVYPRDKDYTDTELALFFLWEHQCQEIWIIGGGGGRTDHLFGIERLFERDPCPDRWFTKGEDIYCLTSPQTVRLTRPAGSTASLFPLGGGPWKIRSRGLKWPLDTAPWNRGFAGVSNETAAPSFSLSLEQGRFLLVLPLTGALPADGAAGTDRPPRRAPAPQ
ncbi:MAG: thiamine diphosphokinase [Spirochaetaceae bacterium]|jgi:thiamine pyrophosphokinase|nr:thiamine diphosphokinase [Spirochaetaceae bacterium]